MNFSFTRWVRVALLNLLLVALMGVIMRYKIAYSLPWINQRNLLQAHSHFAFAGWITQMLMTLMVRYLDDKGAEIVPIKYTWLLFANLITAYGMLFTFPLQGYAALSIIFSTLSIFVSYAFALVFWIDINKFKKTDIASKWFKASLVFCALSSLGAFSLGYMMATKTMQSSRFLASIYFFLHFQYNGWFFFACMGLFSDMLSGYGVSKHKLKILFLLFVIACVPAYFLSALWLPLPSWLYGLVVVSVLIQLIALVLLMYLLRKIAVLLLKEKARLPIYLLVLWTVALNVKLLLQAGSVIPSLSKLAFGFRPIVIGYLHLVLLGVISLFLFFYVSKTKLVNLNKLTGIGIVVFTIGVIFNEILLMVQGIADIGYQPLNNIDKMLLLAALILFASVSIIIIGQRPTMRVLDNA